MMDEKLTLHAGGTRQAAHSGPGTSTLAAAPVRPVCAQSVGRALDPASLDIGGAAFTIAPYARMAESDRITLYFDYGGEAQCEVHTDVGHAWVGQAITLRIPRAALQAADGTQAAVRYAIEPAAGGERVLSDSLDLRIGTDVLLAAPRVIDAVAGYLDVPEPDVEINPSGDAAYDVRIAIPRYRGMTPGDAIWLQWDESPNEGFFRDRCFALQARETVLLVPGGCARASWGQSVAVRYAVIRDGVSEQSEVTIVQVGGAPKDADSDDGVSPGDYVAPVPVPVLEYEDDGQRSSATAFRDTRPWVPFVVPVCRDGSF